MTCISYKICRLLFVFIFVQIFGYTGSSNPNYCLNQSFLPLHFYPSVRLVEEFMLLANMAVAYKIYKTFPKHAILRRHPAPQDKMADDTEQMCRALGIPMDTSSAAAIQVMML